MHAVIRAILGEHYTMVLATTGTELRFPAPAASQRLENCVTTTIETSVVAFHGATSHSLGNGKTKGGSAEEPSLVLSLEGQVAVN